VGSPQDETEGIGSTWFGGEVHLTNFS